MDDAPRILSPAVVHETGLGPTSGVALARCAAATSFGTRNTRHMSSQTVEPATTSNPRRVSSLTANLPIFPAAPVSKTRLTRVASTRTGLRGCRPKRPGGKVGATNRGSTGKGRDDGGPSRIIGGRVLGQPTGRSRTPIARSRWHDNRIDPSHEAAHDRLHRFLCLLRPGAIAHRRDRASRRVAGPHHPRMRPPDHFGG